MFTISIKIPESQQMSSSFSKKALNNFLYFVTNKEESRQIAYNNTMITSASFALRGGVNREFSSLLTQEVNFPFVY